MSPRVYILTWCKHPDRITGTTLTFETLRVGFPNAEIWVVDNNSMPEVRPVLIQHAQSCNAHYVQLTQELAHHAFISQTLRSQQEGAAVFLDPDVCFWKNVEGRRIFQLDLYWKG